MRMSSPDRPWPRGLVSRGGRRAPTESPGPDSRTLAFYREAIGCLDRARVPFLVGGAYAFERYTGIARHTKDLDLFLRRGDRERAFVALEQAGYRTESTFPHWLGKAFGADAVVDLIWSSGNGIAEVDDAWFRHAVEATVLGCPVRLCSPEEMIWSKGFIMERERFDGADVLHLLRAHGPLMRWRWLLRRFGPHWRVLLSHLILFGYVYPGECAIPDWVMALLIRRLQQLGPAAPMPARVCQGTLLSRTQYLVDIGGWGYRDGRRWPRGRMSDEDIRHWTAAIGSPTMSLPTTTGAAGEPHAGEPQATEGRR
jgi:Uncharacterised nucleotidyltransferase